MTGNSVWVIMRYVPYEGGEHIAPIFAINKLDSAKEVCDNHVKERGNEWSSEDWEKHEGLTAEGQYTHWYGRSDAWDNIYTITQEDVI